MRAPFLIVSLYGKAEVLAGVYTGDGVMPTGFWFVLHGLKVKLAMGNGAALLFNAAKMQHGTEGPESCTNHPDQVPRMGIALHCVEPVSGFINVCIIPCHLDTSNASSKMSSRIQVYKLAKDMHSA